MTTGPDTAEYRCNQQPRGCEAVLVVTLGFRDAAKSAAKTAGWRMWTPRLFGRNMAPVFTCPDCWAAER